MPSSKKNIGKDSLLLTVTQLITLGVNMVNAMLLSRFRSLGEYGTYSQIMMVCTVIITFFSAGFSQCINYFLGKSETEEEKRKFVGNYYSLITLIGILGGSIALALLPVLKIYFGNEAIGTLWFVLLLYPVSHILTSGVDRFFINYRRAKWLMAFKVGHSVLVLLVMAFTLLFGLTFYQYMIIYIAVEMLFGLSVYVWMRMLSGTRNFGWSSPLIKQIFAFAVPMALASLVSTINTEMDKLIVGGLVSTEELAIYTNAARELPVYIFSTSISSVVMPFVVRHVSKERYLDAAKLWQKSITLSFYLIGFFVAVMVTFAPQIMSVLYSDKYLPGTNVFRIYSVVLLFRTTYYGMVLNALGKTKTILRASITTMVSNLVLDVLLYQLLGVVGPAIATLLSVGVMNMYQLYLTKKQIGIKFTDIYPLRKIGVILALNGVLAIAFFLLQQVLFRLVPMMDQIVLTVGLGILWVAVYFLLVKRNILTIWKDLNKGDEYD